MIDRSLYDEKQFTADAASINEKQRQKDLEVDPGLSYQVKRNEFHSCIAVKSIPGKSGNVQELMAEIDPEKSGRPLDELNLQWTLGFLPDLMFPGIDTSKQANGRELFIPNILVRDWNETEDPFKTYIYKIITDNFTPGYWIALLECIDNLISYQKSSDNTRGTMEEKAKQLLQDGGLSASNFNKPPREGVDMVLQRYDGLLRGIEDQLKSVGADAQKEIRDSNFKTDGDISGITGSILLVAQQNIQLGGILIEQSFAGKKKTALTDMLLSAIPFMQSRLISSSPYISSTYAKDMMNYMNDSAIKMILKDQDVGNLDANKLLDLSKKLFEDVTVDKEYLLLYGCGITPEDSATITTLKLGGEIEEKNALLKTIFERRPVIVNDALLNKLNDAQKISYYENLASFKLIEKEVFSNLPSVMSMISQSYEKNFVADPTKPASLTSAFKKDIDYYCIKFPNTVLALSDAPDIKGRDPLYEYIQVKCNEQISLDTASEIDVVNSFKD